MKRNLALSILFVSLAAGTSFAQLPKPCASAKPAPPSQVTPAASGDQDAVLARMNQSSPGFKSVEGDFVSQNYQCVVDDTFTDPGHIYFRHAKEGKKDVVEVAFTIEGQAPKQVLYQNGVLRVYEKKTNQITERNVEKDRADVDAFLSLGFGASGKDLTHDYDVKMLGWETMDGTKTAKLELVPKNERLHKTYPAIWLWIDADKDILLQQQFFEQSGDYRLVHYTHMKLNEKIGNDKFKLKTASGATTVRAQ